jgi:hypothetical protein
MTIHAGRKIHHKATPACPNCFSSEHVVEIIYGYPSDELMRAGREDVILGGCCISDDSPAWFCQECKHSFGEIRTFADV